MRDALLVSVLKGSSLCVLQAWGTCEVTEDVLAGGPYTTEAPVGAMPQYL